MTVTWGTWDFTVYSQSGQWNNLPGVYIFAGVSPATNQLTAFYIGETDNFSTRIPGHGRWQEAVRLGATDVHAFVELSAVMRGTIEQGLIHIYQPPLNVHYK